MLIWYVFYQLFLLEIIYNACKSFFRFANKQAIYLDGKISLAHARKHLSQMIKSQNKIIYMVVNILNIYIH